MSARKRWRSPTAKPRQLKAQYGKDPYDIRPDLLYAFGGAGASKPDARVLCAALEEVPVFDGKPLREVLVDRGYDITTLRFSIELLPAATPAKDTDDGDHR